MSDLAYATAPEPPRYWRDRAAWDDFLGLPGKIWTAKALRNTTIYPGLLWAQCGVVRALLEFDSLDDALRQAWKSTRGGADDPLLADNISKFIRLSAVAADSMREYSLREGWESHGKVFYIRAYELFAYLQLPPDPDPLDDLDPSDSDLGEF